VILAYSADQYVAFWTGVAAVATVVAGTVGVLTLFALRRDSRDRTRPVISADIVPVVLSHGTSQLVIRNVGASVARNLELTFEPPIVDTGDENGMGSYIARRYARTIKTVPPGRELSNIYVHMQDGQPTEPLPMDLTVTTSYQDEHGHRYGETYELSVNDLLDQTTADPSNMDLRGRQRRFLRALEAIARGVSR
jgi:hypothetical protein